MIKKIMICVLALITSGFVFLLQYQVNDYNYDLNNLKRLKTMAMRTDTNIEKNIKDLNDSINTINTEKGTITKQIETKQADLTTMNNQIKAKEQQRQQQQQLLVKKYIPNGNGNKIAYLTFDDGPSGYTDRILDILNSYGVKATFFVNGREDANSIRQYQRIVNEGHTIGNHTFYHNYQTNYSSVAGFDYNFNHLQNLIKDTTGVTMNIMRFPGGSNNAVANSYSNGIMNTLTARYKSLGYVYFDWNVTAADSAPSGVTNESVINSILNGCRTRSKVVILMHDPMPTTVNTLSTIITSLSNSGFQFLPLTPSSYCVQFK